MFYRFDPTGLIVEERRYLDSLTPMAQLGLLGCSVPVEYGGAGMDYVTTPGGSMR